ncbi:MAG: hypothetical protein OHK0044_20690 [Burkholderiaceae bacterium]
MRRSSSSNGALEAVRSAGTGGWGTAEVGTGVHSRDTAAAGKPEPQRAPRIAQKGKRILANGPYLDPSRRKRRAPVGCP